MSDKEKNYFISFMDVLGFGTFVKNNLLETVYNSLERILVDLKNIHVEGNDNKSYRWRDEKSYKNFIEYNPKYFKEIATENFYNFSDSIIFYIKASNRNLDNIERFRSICYLSNIFLAKSVLETNRPETKPFVLRCGIAYGPMIIDKKNRIHVGQPLINAYNLAECQNWMGGAIHLSAHPFIREYIQGYNQEVIYYDVPITNKKCKKRKCSEFKTKPSIALNWFKHHPSDNSLVKGMFRAGPTLVDIGNHIKKYNWDDQLEKRNNTLRFVKELDRKWNKMHNVDKSTKKDFRFPPDFK